MRDDYLWVEKYRPERITDYVFKDVSQRKQVQNWITDGGIPHLLFSGSPGTGKTTLIKNLCLKLGSTENVSSPTFPILNIYEDKKIKIYHADLYRVKNIKDLNELGFFEIINNDNWLFIEWPKQILSLIHI